MLDEASQIFHFPSRCFSPRQCLASLFFSSRFSAPKSELFEFLALLLLLWQLLLGSQALLPLPGKRDKSTGSEHNWNSGVDPLTFGFPVLPGVPPTTLLDASTRGWA